MIVGKDTLLVGTSKGLVCFGKMEKDWGETALHFLGFPVSALYEDPRDGAWWVALSHRHWGQKLHVSHDKGKTWEALNTPVYPSEARLPDGREATLRKVWVFAAAGPELSDGMYMGTEPGGLFLSLNKGKSWDLVDSLWRHPSRQTGWFGAGRDHPFIHSIVVDPRDYRHLYVAVSCAGVFESKDGGGSWEVRNRGLRATYLPNPEAELGHDPHRLLQCGSHPEVLWQQNHCGIFRSSDGGLNWKEVSGKDNFPFYGFGLAIDPDNPDSAWVIPAQSDEVRVAVNRALCVCRTNDGGLSWQEQREGLPQQSAFDIIFRHSFVRSGSRLAFGTTNGNLYLTDNNGDNWQIIAGNLPRIEYLQFV